MKPDVKLKDIESGYQLELLSSVNSTNVRTVKRHDDESSQPLHSKAVSLVIKAPDAVSGDDFYKIMELYNPDVTHANAETVRKQKMYIIGLQNTGLADYQTFEPIETHFEKLEKAGLKIGNTARQRLSEVMKKANLDMSNPDF